MPLKTVSMPNSTFPAGILEKTEKSALQDVVEETRVRSSKHRNLSVEISHDGKKGPIADLRLILTLVVLARVAWRFVLGHHVRSLQSGLLRVASTAVHYVFYILLVTQAALGFLSRWEGNEAMSFFGVQIPSPFTGAGQKAAHQLQDIHNWVGWTIVVMAVGHALAALYHYYFLHDRVLGRMLPAAR